MDYEKKYKEALKRAKSFELPEYKNIMVSVFPELKESEDEKIRKTLIEYFNAYPKDYFGGLKKSYILAWLEKQDKKILANSYKTCKVEQKLFDYENANIHQKDYAPKADMPRYSIGDVLCDKSCTMLNKESQSNFEITDIRNGMYICDKCSFPISQQDEYELVAKRIEQKPADNVEAKFKVGDWIIYDGHISKVKDMDSEGYLVEDNYGDEGVPPKEFAEKHYHLWTIVDAKDGDVLTFKNDICGIIICKSPTDYDTGSYCRLASDIFINKEESGWDSTLLVPATKEQRDTLFKAMHEAGYMWNSESKQLLSLKAEPSGELIPAELAKGEDYGIDGLWHAQRILEKTFGKVDGYQTDDGILDHECAISAVKELYEKKPAWSEEDKKEYKYVLKMVDNILNNCGNKKDYEHYKRCYDWLKSLKERIERR